MIVEMHGTQEVTLVGMRKWAGEEGVGDLLAGLDSDIAGRPDLSLSLHPPRPDLTPTADR